MAIVKGPGGNLRGARVYLSGPMDFVASREQERKYGWRRRVGAFLERLGVTVFDPWEKPDVRWFHEYGKEKTDSQDLIKKRWTYNPQVKGQRARAQCAGRFWETLHIDLRMVDTSDLVIAYCPTTIHSVGTVHEVVMARLQRKPVLLVSPHILIPELQQLRTYLTKYPEGAALLERVEARVPIKDNPGAIPSLWYMPLLGGQSFFDGFGFAKYRRRFQWDVGPMDDAEAACPPRRPLLPHIESLQKRKPRKYSVTRRREVDDDDWLLWDFRKQKAISK